MMKRPRNSGGSQEEDAPPDLLGGSSNEIEAGEEETGVCGDEGCEALPAMEDGEQVDGSFTVAGAIPGTGNGAMTGDLTVEGTTFENVPAVCGEKEDVIQIGQATAFSICAVTDMACINSIRTAQSQASFTLDEADLYGRQFDTIFRDSRTVNNFNPALTAFRWLTGNDVSGSDPFVGITASTSVSTWIGIPEVDSVQALAWYLGDYCFDDCPEAQSCSQTCGYQGGDVPDGSCGTIHCGAIQPPAAQDCPTTCGYTGGSVPDGNCGTTTCNPVPAPAAVDCPATCGYEGGEMPDGNCGTKTCNPVAVPEAVACPTTCGYAGGDVVPDGQCGTITCQATATCQGDPGDDDPPTAVIRVVVPAVIPVTDAGGPPEPLIIPVTGVYYTMPFAGFQSLLMNMGLMLFGVTMVLEGIDRKRSK